MNKDKNNPEWTSADFKNAQRLKDTHPEVAEAFKRMPGRPVSAETKQAVSLRLSRRVIEHFKKGGAGWQTRIDGALLEVVERSS